MMAAAAAVEPGEKKEYTDRVRWAIELTLSLLLHYAASLLIVPKMKVEQIKTFQIITALLFPQA